VRDQYLETGVTSTTVDGAMAATQIGTTWLAVQVIFTGRLLNCGRAGTRNVGEELESGNAT